MKNFIIGLIVGFALGGITLAYAAASVLYGSDNIEKGTTANPIYIEVVS